MSEDQLSLRENSKNDETSDIVLYKAQEKDEGIKDLVTRLTILEEKHKFNLLKSICFLLTKFTIIPIQGITVILSVLLILISINFYINNENSLSFKLFLKESLIKIIDSKTINNITIQSEPNKNTTQQQVANNPEKLPTLYYYKSGSRPKIYYFKNPNKNLDMIIEFNRKTHYISYTSGNKYTHIQAEKYYSTPTCKNCTLTEVVN